MNDKAFLVLLVAVSLAFAWILWPLSGAILWGTIIAILFAPLNRRLSLSMRRRRTLAALATLTIVVVIVILPLALIAALLADEASGVYERLRSGEWNIGRSFQQVFDALPAWVTHVLARFELTSLGAVQEQLSAGLMRGSQFLATQALSIGQSTFDFVVNLFVMLYLLFFLLRDGDELVARIKAAIPLRAEQQRALFQEFTVVIRATVKGNIVVAAVQGALGGLIFWLLGIHAPLLWAVIMAVLSLLPAIGAALVWLPVAIYFLATGAVWQGIVLVAYGVLVIGLVDNVLRPLLVGKDTQMPDYLVLLSTLGGIAVFGVNGFVIGPVIAAMFIAAWDIFSASKARPQRKAAGNSLSPESTASGAAWPSPHRDASWITSDSAPTSCASTGPSSIARSRAVPSRHGVHLPQDSRVLKPRSVRTASRTGRLSSSATTPPVPGFTRPRGISGSSKSRGGTTLPDGPPTTAAASARPLAVPPPMRVDERPQRAPELHLDDARPAHVPRDPEQLGAVAAAEAREPGAAALHDRRHRAERLDVVDDRRLAEEAGFGREGRPRARHGAPAFDRLEQRGLLAEHEAAQAAPELDLQAEAAAEDGVADEPPLARLRGGARETRGGEIRLAVDVEDRARGAHRVRREQHAFEEPVRDRLPSGGDP